MGIVAYIDHTDGGNAAALAKIDTHADAGVHATQTLTLTDQPTATDTMTIGTTVYTFRAAVDADAAGEISVGTNLATAKTALLAALAGTDGDNTANPDVTASAFVGNVCTLTARIGGTGPNSIVTTETFTAVGNVFGAATLLGGTSVVPSITYRQPVGFTGDLADPLETEVYALDANATIIAACLAVGATTVSIDGLP